MATLIYKLKMLATAATSVGRPKQHGPLASVDATIAAVMSALAQVPIEQRKAEADLVAANAQRDALLEEGADGDALAAHDRHVDAARDCCRALELFEAAQRRRLAELTAERRRITLADFKVQWHAVAAQLAATMQQAVQQREHLFAVVDKGRASGLEHDVMAFHVPPPVVLGDDEITRWTAAVARLAPDYVAPRPAPAPVAALPAPRAVQQIPADPAPPGPTRIRRPREPAVVPGGTKVQVLRAGYETPDKVQCIQGEIITLPPEIAYIAASNGAVEIIPGDAR
jgi:hypothetical protein